VVQLNPFTMKPITTAQRRMLDAIKAHQQEHGFAPTHRELMKALGYKSTAPVQLAICKLRDKGRVTFLPGQVRTLKVVNVDDRVVRSLSFQPVKKRKTTSIDRE
jgi:SOS-response transcriptional repressor LexA